MINTDNAILDGYILYSHTMHRTEMKTESLLCSKKCYTSCTFVQYQQESNDQHRYCRIRWIHSVQSYNAQNSNEDQESPLLQKVLYTLYNRTLPTRVQ